MEKETNKKSSSWLVPLSIIIGSIIIGASIFFAISASQGVGGSGPRPNIDGEPVQKQLTLEDINPDPEIDLYRGAQNPKITFIEYSDLDCPFCGRFHSSMKEVLEKYPNDVAWIYRHFPLDKLHPDARNKAAVVECVKDSQGPEIAWRLMDEHFSDPSVGFKQVASRVAGLDEASYQNCVENEKYQTIVKNQASEAISLGARGTPFSAVVLPDNQIYPLSGALPTENLFQLVDEILLNS